MTETTTRATQANTAKHINDPFGMLNYQMPNMEVPAQFREMTDKGVAYARDTCAKAKVFSLRAAATPMCFPHLGDGRLAVRPVFTYKIM